MELRLQTLFVGRQFRVLPTCASTNAEAQAAEFKNGATPEGLTILAHHQTAGRGQRGNAWQAPPGENLTFSVVLKPTWLPVARQFDLSIAVALAGADALRTILGPASPVAVKWPNDLYVGPRKVGGILIENTLHGAQIGSSVVGIGLNVNQLIFDPALPNPTSLAGETGHPHERATVLAVLLESLEARYLALRAGRNLEQRAEYRARLYRFGQETTFAFDGRQATGRITGIDARGQLEVQFANGPRVFGVQQVQLVK